MGKDLFVQESLVWSLLEGQRGNTGSLVCLNKTDTQADEWMESLVVVVRT